MLGRYRKEKGLRSGIFFREIMMKSRRIIPIQKWKAKQKYESKSKLQNPI